MARQTLSHYPTRPSDLDLMRQVANLPPGSLTTWPLETGRPGNAAERRMEGRRIGEQERPGPYSRHTAAPPTPRPSSAAGYASAWPVLKRWGSRGTMARAPRLGRARARRHDQDQKRIPRWQSTRTISTCSGGGASARSEAAAPWRLPVIRPTGRCSTSAPASGACGRPTTAGRSGATSPTASSPRRRSAPSASQSRTPTLSTWARERAASGPTWARATASTRRPTAARRGPTSACARAARSAPCECTQRTRTSSTWRRWATPSGRTSSAASSGRRTAATPGSGCSSSAKTPARSTSAWTRATPACSTPPSGRCAGCRGCCRAAARTAGCSSRRTAATPGRS